MCLRARASCSGSVKVRTRNSRCQSHTVRLFDTSLHPFRPAVHAPIWGTSPVCERTLQLFSSFRAQSSYAPELSNDDKARRTANSASAHANDCVPQSGNTSDPRRDDTFKQSRFAVTHTVLSTSPLTLQSRLFYVRLRQAGVIVEAPARALPRPDTDVELEEAK